MGAVRVVDRIRDQSDFTGSLQDGQMLAYQQSSDKFTLKPITFIYNQLIASTTWSVAHNLGRFPVVTIVDSGGNVVIGDVQYVDQNNLTVSFSSSFGGNAYLN